MTVHVYSNATQSGKIVVDSLLPHMKNFSKYVYIISQEIETAIDDRRHDVADGNNGDILTHLSTVLSILDLHNEISKHVPDGTPTSAQNYSSISVQAIEELLY